ncbi:PhzF family phenazine biosynthesis protein [Polycladidibacter hongkongensis]|uniref:PhzF family phenazine biosynthesis protein n=1 Tax=Polycladidibacter hongkongensis TaxID=1647556 RepID=UPI0008349F7B|nr:PhzF family phenazine biosynthesis protein [Pseudovibrio hongkongensis]
MARTYSLLDVFSDKPLSGNPLAVVHDAQGLSDKQMQAIAAEFNLSETVFVLPPEDLHHTAALRIFTPYEELEFAGHPTVGTAAILASRQLQGQDTALASMITLEEKIGIIRCGVRRLENGSLHAEFDLPKLPKPAHQIGSKQDIAAALGIDPLLITFENHVPTSFNAGLNFVYVPLRNAQALQSLAPHMALWDRAFGHVSHNNAFIYTRETLHADAAFQARMLYKGDQIREDAATGSAVAAFAGVIARFDRPLNGTHSFSIEQGLQMGRPSRIDLEMQMQDGKIENARIGGCAAIIASGELYI